MTAAKRRRRPGGGRKPSGLPTRKRAVNIRLTETEHAAVAAAAAAERRPVSDWYRAAGEERMARTAMAAANQDPDHYGDPTE